MKVQHRTGLPHPRLLATLMLVPLAIGAQRALHVACYFYEYRLPTFGYWWWVSGACRILVDVVPLFVLYGGWLAIWWRSVAREGGKPFTVLVTGLVLLVLAVLAAATGFVNPFLQDAALSTIAWGVGAIAVIVLSRAYWKLDTPGVPCPKCGYDLRGQQECRCPECGQQFTVGDLMRRDTGGSS